ncbi:MAG: hypothetical protein ABUS56_02850 [Acidobacteriota bacterium]
MRGRRAGVAFVLAVAFSVSPLTADWCAAACDAAHRQALAPAASADPVCHRAGPLSARLTDVPAPCAHGHDGLPSLVADRIPSGPALAQSVAPAIASTAALHLTSPVRMARPEHDLRPPARTIPLALAASLRI